MGGPDDTVSMTLTKECMETKSYRTFDGECQAHLHIALPDGPEKDTIQVFHFFFEFGMPQWKC